jgi:hypothetical protein
MPDPCYAPDPPTCLNGPNIFQDVGGARITIPVTATYGAKIELQASTSPPPGNSAVPLAAEIVDTTTGDVVGSPSSTSNVQASITNWSASDDTYVVEYAWADPMYTNAGTAANPNMVETYGDGMTANCSINASVTPNSSN